MVFSSASFLFLFLPIFLGLYYLTPNSKKSLTILFGSHVFYAWWRVDFLFLLIAVTAGSYLCAKKIKATSSPETSKKWMIAGVTLNLATLGVFKYFNFGVDSINILFEQAGMNSFEALKFLLPIGISFYIFQSVSFLIDIHRKDAEMPKSFLDFAAFISMFPQLIAGPILRYKDLATQFEKREHNLDHFSEGARRFMIGFSKKVLIADTVAPLADASFALENPTAAEAWLGILAYTVQLYFDFSGYSDMAIGLGLMMGFKFIENFNKPYISRSISEFWRRWHISLSTWLRDYLYIPLGGNRGSNAQTYRNIFLTMLLGGLWHGANWTFIVWGAWHGGLMVLERKLGIRGTTDQIYPFVKNIFLISLTFLLVMIGWVVFRAENMNNAISMYQGMMGFNGWGISSYLSWQIKGTAVTALLLGLFTIFFMPFIKTTKENTLLSFAVITIFILAVLRLLAQSYSPFLYFQF